MYIQRERPFGCCSGDRLAVSILIQLNDQFAIDHSIITQGEPQPVSIMRDLFTTRDRGAAAGASGREIIRDSGSPLLHSNDV